MSQFTTSSVLHVKLACSEGLCRRHIRQNPWSLSPSPSAGDRLFVCSNSSTDCKKLTNTHKPRDASCVFIDKRNATLVRFVWWY